VSREPSSILLVAHFYPPSREVAAHRAAALAKYLARRGHRVTVLTTEAFGSDGADADDNPAVIRSHDLQLAAARVRGDRMASDAMSRSESSGPTLVGRIAVPDGHLLAWFPFAWPRALRLLRDERPDCVVTTSPPESAHLIGRSLQRRGVAWIADLRDGWTFENAVKQEIWPLEIQHRLNGWLERRTLRHADLITTVSEPLVADAAARFGQAELLTNGFDPDKVSVEADANVLDPERFSFVYTGRIAGATARDARPLIEAVTDLARTDPARAERLELAFAGPFTREEAALFQTDVSPARIVNLGLLTHERTLALQRAADALVIITDPETTAPSAKLYEYLATGRPIIALSSEHNALAPILRDTDSGLVVPARGVEPIRDALVRAMSGQVTGASEDARARYSYPVIADRLGELADTTVEHVRAGRRPAG
jgi:glycosyltransferase involved in cell wall biosynthesis